jgi:hypothetical protein
VKLRGRTTTPDGAEGAQSLSARGAKPQARHGPLQRLLDRMTYHRPMLSQRFRNICGKSPCQTTPRRQATMSDTNATSAQTQPGIATCHHCIGPGTLNDAAYATPNPKRADRAKAGRTHLVMRSNGEVEGPRDHARQATRAHTVLPRPRRHPRSASRTPPTIVRGRGHRSCCARALRLARTETTIASISQRKKATANAIDVTSK